MSTSSRSPRPSSRSAIHHDLLLANALAQAQALAFGRTADELRRPACRSALVPHKEMPGNRPTTFLLLERLTPFALGSLVALYEHVVFTAGRGLGHRLVRPVGRRAREGARRELAPVIAGEARAPNRSTARPPRSSSASGSSSARADRARAPRARGRVRADRVLAARAGVLRAGRRGRSSPICTSATGSRRLSAGRPTPAPAEPCALPLVACVVRTDGHAGVMTTRWSSRHRCRDGDDGSRSARGGAPGPGRATPRAVDAVRDAIGRGDVYQVNLVQHLSAPFAGSPRALAARLAPLTQPNELPFADAEWRVLRGRRLGDRHPPLPSSSSPGAGDRRLDAADQGNAAARPSRGAPRLGEGRGRARDDRRPRAERPLARLPSRAACAGRR